MKIVLLTARILTPAQIDEAVAGLEVPADEPTVVSLVLWRRPREVVPVARYLVLGPERGIDAWQAFRNGGLAPDPDDTAVTEPSATAEADVPKAPKVPLPWGPRRLVAAGTWRLRRAKLAVVRSPLRARILKSTKVRRAKAKVMPGGVASQYAVAALRSRPLAAAVDGADLVVALDTATHRAAWLLARRHPGPDVLVGVEAARTRLRMRREGDLST